MEAKTGFEADLRKIPLRQEVIEVCELVDVNPYRLHAKGCILFTARNGEAAKKALEDEGIPCTVIGWMDIPWYHALALGAVMDVFGVYGDLFESQWKRHYNVKDSGNSIPGHGGFLDRFDSALFAIPAGVIYLSLFGLL